MNNHYNNHYMEPKRELNALNKLLVQYAEQVTTDPRLKGVIELYKGRVAELEYEVAVAA